MKVKIVTGRSIEGFEQSMEFYLDKLMDGDKEIIDIKFGGSTEQQFGYGTSYIYSAMIIYQDN